MTVTTTEQLDELLSRPNAAEVLVTGDQFKKIRHRETYADLTAPEENL